MILRPFKYRDLRPGDMITYTALAFWNRTLVVLEATHGEWLSRFRWVLAESCEVFEQSFTTDDEPPDGWYRVAREGEG